MFLIRPMHSLSKFHAIIIGVTKGTFHLSSQMKCGNRKENFVGNLGFIFRAVLRALKRTVLVLRDGVLWPLQVADGFLGGVFGGGQPEVVEEVVEDAAGEALVEHQARQAVAEQLTTARVSLGRIARRACECRDGGAPMVGLFDERDPVHRNLRSWVERLSVGGLRLVRHMPVETLERHLDQRDPFRASGLQAFTAAPARMIEPTPAPTPSVDQPKRKRTRNMASGALQAARYEGRRIMLGDLVAPGRR